MPWVTVVPEFITPNRKAPGEKETEEDVETEELLPVPLAVAGEIVVIPETSKM